MATTYYTSHNAGGGGVGSIPDPFTLQEAADTAVTSDTVLMMNTGTYAPGAPVDFDTNVGTAILPINFRGANADGSDDGTIILIDGAGIGAAETIFNLNLTGNHLILDNVKFQNATQSNMYTALTVYMVATNCFFNDSDVYGVECFNTTAAIKFIDCEIADNDSHGVYEPVARGGNEYWRCNVHDNGGDGLHITAESAVNPASSRIMNTLIYANTGAGIYIEGVADYEHVTISGCVIALNTGDGIEFEHNNSGWFLLENTIIRSNGGYGINTNSGTNDIFISIRNNCTNNNTSGHIDINGNVLPGPDNITSDPKFVNEGAGVEDFHLQSDSPCIAAGIDGGIW